MINNPTFYRTLVIPSSENNNDETVVPLSQHSTTSNCNTRKQTIEDNGYHLKPLEKSEPTLMGSLLSINIYPLNLKLYLGK